MEITRRNTVLYIHCSRSGGATAERPQKRPEPSGRMVGCGGGQSVNKYTRACESCGQRVRARVVRKRDFALHYVFSASSSSLTHFLLYAGFNPSRLASAGVLGSHTTHGIYHTLTRARTTFRVRPAFEYELMRYTRNRIPPPVRGLCLRNADAILRSMTHSKSAERPQWPFCSVRPSLYIRFKKGRFTSFHLKSGRSRIRPHHPRWRSNSMWSFVGPHKYMHRFGHVKQKRRGQQPAGNFIFRLLSSVSGAGETMQTKRWHSDLLTMTENGREEGGGGKRNMLAAHDSAKTVGIWFLINSVRNT